MQSCLRQKIIAAAEFLICRALIYCALSLVFVSSAARICGANWLTLPAAEGEDQVALARSETVAATAAANSGA